MSDITDSAGGLGAVPKRHGKSGEMPKRIQRKRTKGFDLRAASSNPKGYRYVGRPGRYGNPFYEGMDTGDIPFVVVKHMKGEMGAALNGPQVLEAFGLWLEHHHRGQELAERARRELRGKDLVCWCPLSSPCHADILLSLANA